MKDKCRPQARHSGRQDTDGAFQPIPIPETGVNAYPRGSRALPKGVVITQHEGSCQNYNYLTFEHHINLAFVPTIPTACLTKRFPTNLPKSGCPSRPIIPPPAHPWGHAHTLSESQFKIPVTSILTTALRGGCHDLPRRQTQAVTVSLNHTFVQLQGPGFVDHPHCPRQ